MDQDLMKFLMAASYLDMVTGGTGEFLVPKEDIEDLACGARFIPSRVTVLRKMRIPVSFHPTGHYWTYDVERLPSLTMQREARGTDNGTIRV